MFTQKIVINNNEGLHARPAAKFVQTGAQFTSKITINKGDKEVDAKSILNVMSLGIKKGTEVTISAEGPDEEKAVLALIQLINNDFG